MFMTSKQVASRNVDGILLKHPLQLSLFQFYQYSLILQNEKDQIMTTFGWTRLVSDVGGIYIVLACKISSHSGVWASIPSLDVQK